MSQPMIRDVQSKSGVFCVSLDFELHWGGFEKWPLAQLTDTSIVESGHQYRPTSPDDYTSYFLNTRQVIPELLRLFERFEIHVTWATVGMLFHHSRQELLDNAPSMKPGYFQNELSAYNYIDKVGIGENERRDPFHFAPTLLSEIAHTAYQEIGTHTFGHYYCNEPGQTLEQFRLDLQAAQRVALSRGLRLRSLVFPRNQFNDHYLQVCCEEGITSVRSNPLDWFWRIESTAREPIWKRLNRGLDAYFPIGKRNTYTLASLNVRPNYPICLPASRLLRPYRPSEGILNELKLIRIESEMTRAAKQREVYHLWWHPHNFGHYPAENLAGLERILEVFKKCTARYGMVSRNMGEIADIRWNEK